MTSVLADPAVVLAASVPARRHHPKLSSALVVVALHVLILVVYLTVVVKVYGYEGYRSRTVPFLWLMPSVALSLVPIAWLPTRPDRPSAIILWLLHVFVVVPTCAITPLIPVASFWRSVGFSCWVVVCSGLAALGPLLPRLSAARPPMDPDAARKAFVAFSSLVIATLVARFGLPTSLFAYNDIYVRRLEFRATLAGSSGAFGYLIGWLTSTISPILVVSGIVRRHALSICVGGFAMVWVFVVSATRQSLVAVPFGVILFWAARRRTTGVGYGVGALGLLGVSGVGYAATGNLLFVGAVAERLFAVPGLLGAFYFDFFQRGPAALYRDSFGATFSHSPFDRPITYEIGTTYLNRPQANANVNVFVDGFANLWLAGLLIGVLLGLVLWSLDVAARRSALGPTMASLVLIVLALMNVGLTVALLTNGLILAVIVIWLAGPALFGPAEGAG